MARSRMTTFRTAKLPDDGLGLIESVVGRADQWAGFDVFEAHLFAQNFIL